MALIIENGSLVANANSYVTVGEVRAYAAARASTIPAAGGPGDGAIEAAAVRACDFIESMRGEFQGVKVAPATQSLQFPREGVSFEGYDLPDDAIPLILKNAQCQLAIEAVNGLDLMPTGDGRKVIRKKVDVLETEWAAGTETNPLPQLVKARALLAPLLSNGGGNRLVVDRA